MTSVSECGEGATRSVCAVISAGKVESLAKLRVGARFDENIIDSTNYQTLHAFSGSPNGNEWKAAATREARGYSRG